jgi:hypothetical protein
MGVRLGLGCWRKELDPRYLMLDGYVKVQHPNSNSFIEDVIKQEYGSAERVFVTKSL